jgi:hypothetical protein
LLNWHKVAKVPISREAGLRRDNSAAAPGALCPCTTRRRK